LNAAAILLFASTLIWATGRRRRIDVDQSAAAKGA
jgi:hypothetical protein